MTSKLTLSALAILIAAPAFAGATQAERSAGVEPGIYTLAQVGEIAAAETVAEAARLRAFYADRNETGVSRDAVSGPSVNPVPDRPGGADRR